MHTCLIAGIRIGLKGFFHGIDPCPPTGSGVAVACSFPPWLAMLLKLLAGLTEEFSAAAPAVTILGGACPAIRRTLGQEMSDY